VAEPTGVETPADDAAYFNEELAEDGTATEPEAEDVPSEYTTESAEAAAPRVARRPVITGHANGTGRRKEAVARVRIVPGTGQWKINGRSLDAYFPNKVHQQIVSEPFVTLGAEDSST
jgi:small subunit ribosomal protein S9